MSYAVRNGRLCTKDCLCLYVCPSGATDTETGKIDASKCISGCRLCVDVCPSGAISLVPDKFPPQQSKKNEVVNSLLALLESKVEQENIAKSILASSTDSKEQNLLRAIISSNRIMAEDIIREAGYMLPQSENSIKLLKEEKDESLKETVSKLISLLSLEK